MGLRAVAPILCLAVAACAEHRPETVSATKEPAAIVITRRADLDAAVGKRVTLEGVVSNTKIPTILGVDVVSDNPDLRGKMARASGILHRTTVTREALDREIAKRGMFAHRGPGTYYRLVPARPNDAQVQPTP
jgi:hypothetical protein